MKTATPLPCCAHSAATATIALQNHGFPASLDALLAGMMAKNAEWRFGGYVELIAEIKACKTALDDAPAARPAAASAQASARARRARFQPPKRRPSAASAAANPKCRR